MMTSGASQVPGSSRSSLCSPRSWGRRNASLMNSKHHMKQDNVTQSRAGWVAGCIRIQRGLRPGDRASKGTSNVQQTHPKSNPPSRTIVRGRARSDRVGRLRLSFRGSDYQPGTRSRLQAYRSGRRAPGRPSEPGVSRAQRSAPIIATAPDHGRSGAVLCSRHRARGPDSIA